MRFIPIIIAAVSSVACAGAVKGRGELGYSAYKSSPPPANYGKVPLYGQCGAGEGKWDGPTECVPEAGAPAPVYSAPPPPPSKIPLYGQCGAGEGEWKGPTECAEGSCMAIQEYYSQCLKDAPPMYAPPPPPTETAPAKEYAPPAKGYLPPKKEYSPPAPPKYPENNGYTKHTSAYRRRQLVNSVTNNVGLTSDPDHKLPAIPLIKAQKFGQCGGMEYSGPSVCPDAYTCKKMDDYYSQCTPLST